MARTAFAAKEQRQAAREEVFYRTRGTSAAGVPLALLVVNISAMGLMARCDGSFAPGDRIKVLLPVIGITDAEVRWALGGRIGCELDQPIALHDYYALLAALVKGR